MPLATDLAGRFHDIEDVERSGRVMFRIHRGVAGLSRRTYVCFGVAEGSRNLRQLEIEPLTGSRQSGQRVARGLWGVTSLYFH